MITYYITVLLVIIFASLAESLDYLPNDNLTYGLRQHTYSAKLWFVFAALVLIIVGGFRYGVGTDYWTYFSSGERYIESMRDAIKNFDEPGIRVLYWLVQKFTTNKIAPMFVSHALTIGLMLRIVYRYSDQLLFAIVLFIFLGCWHSSFNAVRQCLACAIIFCGFPFLREKKFCKYLFVCVLAFLFHRSAIIMFAAYFVAHLKMNHKNRILLIVGSVVILFSYDWVISFTEFVLNDSLSKDAEYARRAVNILRILVAIAPAVFYTILYSERQTDDNTAFYYNLILINAIVMTIASKSAMIARVGIYTAPFVVISIPELNKAIAPASRKIVNLLMCVLYGIYFFYEVITSSSLNPFVWAF